MPQIPLDQKFHTLDADTPTQERGSSLVNAGREIYTMQDIVDTAGGGGGGVTDVDGETGSITITGGDGIEVDVVTGTGEIEISSTGGSTTGIDLSLVVRDAAYGSIGDHEGTVLTIGVVPALAQVHYWGGASWSLANASAVGTASGLLCMGTAANGDALVDGIMQLGAVPGAAGDVLYLNNSNGTLTAVAPAGIGEIVRVCGYNLGGNRVYFNPSKDFIEIG